MEVVLHDVKPDPQQSLVPDLERNNSSSKNHHNSSYNPSKPRNPSSNLPTHKISTIQSLNSSTPVRIISSSISGGQLQTMAKSSGLSVVHVTVPQVYSEFQNSLPQIIPIRNFLEVFMQMQILFFTSS